MQRSTAKHQAEFQESSGREGVGTNMSKRGQDIKIMSKKSMETADPSSWEFMETLD